MEVKKITKKDFKVSSWAGGETTEISIYPDSSLYSERNFLFRLSFATCLLDSSDFTSLPDYERVLSVIKGNIVLDLKDKNEEKPLSPYEFYYFDGKDKISSRGQCTDFNLMTRKNKCKGSAESFLLKDEEKKIDVPQNALAVLVFLTEGEIKAEADSSFSLSSFEALRVIEPTLPQIALKGSGKGFIAYVLH